MIMSGLLFGRRVDCGTTPAALTRLCLGSEHPDTRQAGVSVNSTLRKVSSVDPCKKTSSSLQETPCLLVIDDGNENRGGLGSARDIELIHVPLVRNCVLLFNPDVFNAKPIDKWSASRGYGLISTVDQREPIEAKMETEKFDAIVIGAGQAGPSLPAD
jgi:hypothetical protein